MATKALGTLEESLLVKHLFQKFQNIALKGRGSGNSRRYRDFDK
jgi:hypothetical protein